MKKVSKKLFDVEAALLKWYGKKTEMNEIHAAGCVDCQKELRYLWAPIIDWCIRGTRRKKQIHKKRRTS